MVNYAALALTLGLVPLISYALARMFKAEYPGLYAVCALTATAVAYLIAAILFAEAGYTVL